MALATSLIISFEDDKGKSSTTKIKVPSTFAIADYVEFGTAIGQLVVNITNARVTGISIGFGMDLTAIGSLKSVASGVCSVAVKMFGLFNTAASTVAKWLIPGPLETKVVAGSDDFDQVDADVAALVTAMEDGIVVTGGTMEFTDGRGNDATSVSQLKETFRRRSPG